MTTAGRFVSSRSRPPTPPPVRRDRPVRRAARHGRSPSARPRWPPPGGTSGGSGRATRSSGSASGSGRSCRSSGGDEARYHAYAFATVRMAGAGFDLLAAHADWLLGELGAPISRGPPADRRGQQGPVFKLARRRAFDPVPASPTGRRVARGNGSPGGRLTGRDRARSPGRLGAESGGSRSPWLGGCRRARAAAPPTWHPRASIARHLAGPVRRPPADASGCPRRCRAPLRRSCARPAGRSAAAWLVEGPTIRPGSTSTRPTCGSGRPSKPTERRLLRRCSSGSAGSRRSASSS